MLEHDHLTEDEYCLGEWNVISFSIMFIPYNIGVIISFFRMVTSLIAFKNN